MATPVSTETIAPSVATPVAQKLPLRFTANGPRVGLQFVSEDELDRAIDWLWATPELRELPRVHVGENTMIVPLEALELFREKGYSFVECRVVSAGDLPAEEVNRIRREG